jgi:hypothetical protein
MADTVTSRFIVWWRKFLTLLRVRSVIGGLEIGDIAMRYTLLDGESWKLHSLRLPPGIVEGGVIKDYPQFVAALKNLKAQILGPQNVRKDLNVVVSLSSINVYSQVFSLPMVAGSNLEKAIQLNVQMISPEDTAKSYAGWQLVSGGDRSVHLEVLSAFINKSVVDDVKRALKESGFVVYSLESRALSLARLIRKMSAGFDATRSYIAVNVDANGIQFLIIRHGQLYFEYFTAWRDIENEGHQISQSVLEDVVMRNLHQVLNFYTAHWTDPAQEVVVSAAALGDIVMAAAQRTFSVPVRALVLNAMRQPIEPDWYVAVGCGLRGLIARREDTDLSLLGTSAQDEFRRYQTLAFLRFWRVVVPVSLTVLLVAFVGVRWFFVYVGEGLQDQLSRANTGPDQQVLLRDLRERIGEFNALVANIGTIRNDTTDLYGVFGSVQAIFDAEGATITKFSYPSADALVQISGRASSEDVVPRIKKALDATAGITDTDIPIAGVVPAAQGVSFSVSFRYAPANTATSVSP